MEIISDDKQHQRLDMIDALYHLKMVLLIYFLNNTFIDVFFYRQKGHGAASSHIISISPYFTCTQDKISTKGRGPEISEQPNTAKQNRVG